MAAGNNFEKTAEVRVVERVHLVGSAPLSPLGPWERHSATMVVARQVAITTGDQPMSLGQATPNPFSKSLHPLVRCGGADMLGEQRSCIRFFSYFGCWTGSVAVLLGGGLSPFHRDFLRSSHFGHFKSRLHHLWPPNFRCCGNIKVLGCFHCFGCFARKGMRCTPNSNSPDSYLLRSKPVFQPRQPSH